MALLFAAAVLYPAQVRRAKFFARGKEVPPKKKEEREEEEKSGGGGGGEQLW